MDERPDERCCFDDWVTPWVDKAGRRGTAARVTEALVDALDGAGIQDRTVLDIGCGIGDLSMESLDRGAIRATGVELSPKAIREGTRMARDRGLADRMTFVPGDGSKIELPRADVVVLNRVFCCYPDVEGLVRNSLAAAGSVYAFTAPPSRGVAGRFGKIQTAISNVWYRVRDKKFHGFRVFIHDLDAIDETVRAAGFHRTRFERRRLVWQVAVYVR